MGDHATDDVTLPPLMLGGSLWAIRPDVLPRLTEAHRLTDTPDWARFAARAAANAPQAARRTKGQRTGGAVAVLPLTGVLTPRGSFLSQLFGGGMGGLQGFREEFREAVASPDIGAIVLDVDSPGGLVDLVPETAAEVREARGTKPIISVCNTMAASGAYWIAAQADEIVATPSGEAGSVGVYMVHEDWSRANEQMGIAVTYVSAGKYKVEGNMDEPLSEEAQEAFQAEVDELYGMFVTDVAAGRGTSAANVRDGYGEGRTLLAARALEAGMIDRIDTIEAVIGELLSPGSTGASASRVGRASLTLAGLRAEEGEPTPEPDEVDPPQPTDPPEDAPVDPPATAPEPAVPAEDPDDEPAPDEDDDAGDDPEPSATDAENRAAVAALLAG